MTDQILKIAARHLAGAELAAYAELLGGLRPGQLKFHLEWMQLLDDHVWQNGPLDDRRIILKLIVGAPHRA